MKTGTISGIDLRILRLACGLVTVVACVGIDEGPSPTVVRTALDPAPGGPGSGMRLPTPEIPWLSPPGAGELKDLGDRLEQCFERGGTLKECAETAALCFLRDQGVGLLEGGLAEKLQLFELFKNYYCDGECYHCCWAPGTGPGGAGGGCHTSFDASEGPVLNCQPGLYGPGTQGLGPALVIGDALGLGICIGGVQQVCNHLPLCNGAGSTAIGDPDLSASDPNGGSAASLTREQGDTLQSVSPPPHANMSHPNAAPLRAKGFEAALRRNLVKILAETPARERRRAYVDFATARGAVNWVSALGQVEPYDGTHEAFRVTNTAGQLRDAASYHQGITFHTNLALLGAVPNLKTRLEYVESRYWTEDEKNVYLGGIDPETELLKTMGPLALAALKGAPVQDWRLLAVAAPGETALAYRSFEGFALGQAPILTLAQDCAGQDQVTIAVGLQDPAQAGSGDTRYPLMIDWGDGSLVRQTYDSALPANVFQHAYAAPGKYLAYVTASNSTGLRGVSGVVVESTAVVAPEVAAIASASPAIATVALDDVEAYGPALVSAGDLGLTIEVSRSGEANRKVGWSDAQTLPNKGPTVLGDVIGYNEALTPIDTIVIRATRAGGYYYESVYLKSPSLTLGVQSAKVGAIVTRSTPLTADMVRVYYVGATVPVPPELLERDVNGDLLLPVERRNSLLPVGFCGASACFRIDRIEIPITAAQLGTSLPDVRPVPGDLPVGGTARWVEDVPSTFVPVLAAGLASLAGSCQSSLQPLVVAAAAPVPSLVTALTITPAEAAVSTESGRTLQAFATLVDGSTLDVTDKVTWSSSADTVVRVSNGEGKGSVVAAIVPGTSTISASLGGVSASAVVTNTNAARGFRSYRVLIQAIHGSLGKAGISSVELMVDGRVLPGLMTSLTLGTIGPFPATVQSSPGSAATYAFDAAISSSWTSTTGTFDRLPPYAVLSAPVYLQVTFPEPVPVHGVRLIRQGGINSASYKPQFPKDVIVQGSNDGLTFETITQTSFENWNGLPALVEWTVPPATPQAVAAP